MNITLIGNPTGHDVQRLAEEAEKLGVTFEAVSVSSLILSEQNNVFGLFDANGRNVTNSDCYIFRGIGDADNEVMVIAKYLQRHGATIIEENTANGSISMDKLFLRAADHTIPMPNYLMIQNAQALESVTPTLVFPVVMKSTIGSMGRNVILVENAASLCQAYDKLGPRVILQEYLPVDHDIRAIVINGQYIDSYRRTRDDGEFRMNRPGNHKDHLPLPDEAISICERAAQYQNIEIAGIDLTHYNGTWYVLEVNTSPQFHMFETYTNKNIAKLLLEYAVSKTAANASLSHVSGSEN
ncbi:MAG: ATP-grasp domain-containing protein [Candidatus Paceibacterota bacterium]